MVPLFSRCRGPVAFLALLLSSLGRGTQVAWSEINVTTKPDGRYGHDMVYDSRSRAVWMWGGSGSSGRLSDLWKFDTQSVTWSQQSQGSTIPDGRHHHGLVYDSSGHALWLFGGGFASGYADDLWKLDISTLAWSAQTPTSTDKPQARAFQAMVYDTANNAIWMHGGYTPSFLDDLWKFDIETLVWSAQSLSTKPEARASHRMVYDSDRQVLWLFSGDSPLQRDLWKFDIAAVAWEKQSVSNMPSARIWHDMVYDSGTQTLWILLGQAGGNVDDTWQFEISTTTFTEHALDPRPSARSRQRSVYDSDSQVVWLFGGGSLQDTWRLQTASTTSSTSSSTTTASLSSSSTSSRSSSLTTSRLGLVEPV